MHSLKIQKQRRISNKILFKISLISGLPHYWMKIELNSVRASDLESEFHSRSKQPLSMAEKNFVALQNKLLKPHAREHILSLIWQSFSVNCNCWRNILPKLSVTNQKSFNNHDKGSSTLFNGTFAFLKCLHRYGISKREKYFHSAYKSYRLSLNVPSRAFLPDGPRILR